MKRPFMSFEEAQLLARRHRIESRPQWAQFVKTRSPRDVPANPAVVYKDQWTTWGDFLGTGRIADKDKNAGFLSYEDAKRYLGQFEFQSEAEFYAWAKTDQRPPYIPASPRKTYASKGWQGMGDFLSNGNLRTKDFLPFEEARTFVRLLGLRELKEWKEWAKSDKRPDTIPHNPNIVYASSGWAGFADWLGYERRTSYGEKIVEYFLKTNEIEYRPQYVLDGCRDKANLRFDFAVFQNGELMALIEFHGIQHYKDVPFFNADHTKNTDKIKRRYCDKNGITLIEMSYADLEKADSFLQTRLAPIFPYYVFRCLDRRQIISSTHWMDFDELRSYIRSLNFPSVKEYKKWATNHRPIGCPSDVVKIYRHRGWVSWADFLGLRKVSPRNAREQMMTYEECKRWMRDNGVLGRADWDRRAKNKPINVPSSPDQFYGRSGEWRGWNEFLMPD